uniref:Uncharacterized protein n=1 Tax=Anguilla anguilla TaxID=7936 RepID=A0A0E9RF67_ANGAN
MLSHNPNVYFVKECSDTTNAARNETETNAGKQVLRYGNGLQVGQAPSSRQARIRARGRRERSCSHSS